MVNILYNSRYVADKLLSDYEEALAQWDITVRFLNEDLGYDAVSELLNKGEVNMGLLPLHLVPVHREESIKLWAMSSRKSTHFSLLIRKDCLDINHKVPVAENEVITSSINLQVNLLRQVRPDLVLKPQDSSETLISIDEGSMKVALIESQFLMDKDLETYQKVDLNAREFGHLAGQGAYVFVGSKQDLMYGPIVRKMHNSRATSVSNMERRLASALSDSYLVHSELDRIGNYHLYAFNHENGRKVHFSQSTKNNLVEKVLDQIHPKSAKV